MEKDKRTENALTIASSIVGIGLTWTLGILVFCMTEDGKKMLKSIPEFMRDFLPFLLMGNIFLGFATLLGMFGLLQPLKQHEKKVMSVQKPIIRYCLLGFMSTVFLLMTGIAYQLF